MGRGVDEERDSRCIVGHTGGSRSDLSSRDAVAFPLHLQPDHSLNPQQRLRPLPPIKTEDSSGEESCLLRLSFFILTN